MEEAINELTRYQAGMIQQYNHVNLTIKKRDQDIETQANQIIIKDRIASLTKTINFLKSKI